MSGEFPYPTEEYTQKVGTVIAATLLLFAFFLCIINGLLIKWKRMPHKYYDCFWKDH